jgi:uncharacterized protein (TIGR01777 family)
MLIVMAGSSGFLGSRLRQRLTADGHAVLRLVRQEPVGLDQRRWWPQRRQLDPDAIAGADAVINLAGVGIGDHRWNAAFKERIRSSRVDATATLATAIAAVPAERRPGILLNASGVGFYGDTGDVVVDEDGAPGEGFLADVCQVWEAATAPAEDNGVRVAKMRTGLPLDARGGLLKRMLVPFRLGLGGRLGDGRQWLPWISMADWLAAVSLLLTRSDLAGPVNLVGPAPVRDSEFTRVLGAALRRPAVAAVPALALRIVLGEFAVEALASQRIMPGRLTQAGFSYAHPTVASAVDAALR